MSMTKKDYELIAKSFNSVISDCETQEELEVVYELAESLAVDLKDNNSLFDKDKFLTACGVK